MVEIATFEGGYDKNFTYLVWCPTTGAAALVDAATPPGPVEEIMAREGLHLTGLLLTHSHADHLIYLENWLEKAPDVKVVGSRNLVVGAWPNYRGLPDRGELAVGDSRMVLLDTPGHYPDCVCWYEPESQALFTGDTVFVGRTGRTINPLSDIGDLYRSVGRLLALPPETVVYPGHNYGPTPTATLGELQARCNFFQCENEAAFRRVMVQYERDRKSGC